MSKIKKEIARVINEVKKSTQYTYGARFYEASQVVAILTDILDSDDTVTESGGTITSAMVKQLVEALKENVKDSVNNISADDVVDEDSFDITIRSGSVSIDDYELDKESIGETAVESIREVVFEWLDDNEIQVETE